MIQHVFPVCFDGAIFVQQTSSSSCLRAMPTAPHLISQTPIYPLIFPPHHCSAAGNGVPSFPPSSSHTFPNLSPPSFRGIISLPIKSEGIIGPFLFPSFSLLPTTLSSPKKRKKRKEQEALCNPPNTAILRLKVFFLRKEKKGKGGVLKGTNLPVSENVLNKGPFV